MAFRSVELVLNIELLVHCYLFWESLSPGERVVCMENQRDRGEREERRDWVRQGEEGWMRQGEEGWMRGRDREWGKGREGGSQMGGSE